QEILDSRGAARIVGRDDREQARALVEQREEGTVEIAELSSQGGVHGPSPRQSSEANVRAAPAAASDRPLAGRGPARSNASCTRWTSALPTIATSAARVAAATSCALAMPNPTATGSSPAAAFTRRRKVSALPSNRVPAPVTPNLPIA